MYKVQGLMIAMTFIASVAHAKVATGTNANNDVFKVDSKNGRIVSAIEAVKLAPDHDIYRCKPIKGAETIAGGIAEAYKCKPVVLEYNPKTGMPKWKSE